MRRRSRGAWFPNIGTQVDPDLNEETVGGRQFEVNLAGNNIITGIIPLTFDQPFEGEQIQPGVDSLADIVGSDYVLQRIVGKLHIERTSTFQSDVQDRNPAILVGCGFFVGRANDTAVGGGAATPIGSATEAERRDNYSPLEVDTVREPWIWRRNWILGNASPSQVNDSGFISTFQNSVRHYPASTALYGSVADGPHIDSRVKRKVSQDNRLWFAISAVTFPLGLNIVFGSLGLVGYLDYRIFGSIRKAKGSSAF